MSRLLTPGQDSILSYATCTPRPQGLKIMMKSRDILCPDIGPGIRTQDSVVTSGTTTSYATEGVSSAWYSLRGVTGSCTAGYHGIPGPISGDKISLDFIIHRIRAQISSGYLRGACWAVRPVFLERLVTIRSWLHTFIHIKVAASVTGRVRASLFLASIRFCMHYCIDRHTVQKNRTSRGVFVGLSTTNLKMIWKQATNKQTALIWPCGRWRRTQTHTHTHTQRQIDTHRRCARACVSVCMYVCVRVCVCVCVCACICIYKGMYAFMCVCVYVFMYLCTYASLYLCIYMSMYPCIYASMYLCICVWMFVCLYVCMYVCM